MNAALGMEFETHRKELAAICARLGVRRPVDLVTPPGLANPYFRQRVEQEKTLLYAA